MAKLAKQKKTRDTGTGKIFEQTIIPALKGGGYNVYAQTHVGERFGGNRKHLIDIIAENESGQKFLVSLKWQQVHGTAEQKVPYEVICLAEAVRGTGIEFAKAYLVLGGEGWTLRDFFTKGGLDSHLKHASLVKIVTLENFIAIANRGIL